MVQIHYLPKQQRDIGIEALGSSIGEGLGKFTTTYFANKALDKVLNDQSLKDKALSEKMDRLESATRPYGEYGQNILARRLGIEQQRHGEQMFKKARDVANKKGSTPADILFSLMEAGQGVPGSERYIAPAYEALTRQMQIKGGQDYNPYGEDGSQTAPRQREEDFVANTAPQRNALPNFSSTGTPEPNTQFFPTNNLGNQKPGNIPQPTTGGVVRPIPTPEQQLREAQDLSRKFNIPLNESIPLVRDRVQTIKDFNNQVQSDTQNRVTSQQRYGQLAEERLQKYLPEATDEQRAFFKKKGEEASENFKSEADIDRYLSGEVRKFKNNLTNIRDSIPPQRAYNMPQQTILGTNTAFEKRKADIRQKLKPLLEAGLYDTARNTLSEVGYYPEERESIIGDLGEGSKKAIAQMPTFPKKYKPSATGTFSVEIPSLGENEKGIIKNTLKQALQNDPSANTILLRRAFEEKNVDWRTFKDVFNEVVDGEEIPGFKLSDDQFNQLNTLENPPLNGLEKILHGLHLIGR